ncbi:MAG: saccharopine dehydrogenase, partial [Gammaproteobacteria bacterium]
HFVNEYTTILNEIQFAIVPGSNVDLGEATLKGILSHIGRPFKTWEEGKYTLRNGWMDIRRMDFGVTLGKRWLANVDIPDLELFPSRYPGVQTVRFQAGHELSVIHLSLALMAYLSKHKLVSHWERFSSPIFNLSRHIKKLGSDTGGMVIQLDGMNKEGSKQKIIWRLLAKSGAGPRIPTISAIILANRILDGKLTEHGARPCLGMYHLDEFFTIARNWGIYEEVERIVG